ncbi:MAG: nucleotidyltransferase domain-containing protein [Silvibacterium sp.]
MHIYAFGSVCRGEVSRNSDVDLLALVDGRDARFDPNKYSIYSYSKIAILWSQGSPFAWHLMLESRLLFASDGLNFLQSLGQPAPYTHCVRDCEKFFGVFCTARSSLAENSMSRVFDLSAIFLSVRNIATCFALGVLGAPNFSRHAALTLGGEFVLPLSPNCYRILERSRILSTRSSGADISEQEFSIAVSEFEMIDEWMKDLMAKAREHERVLQPR